MICLHAYLQPTQWLFENLVWLQLKGENSHKLGHEEKFITKRKFSILNFLLNEEL